jgi:hypothetical protein
MAQDLAVESKELTTVEPVREYDIRGGGRSTAPCPRMGEPARSSDSVRPWLVAMRHVLERSGRWPARRPVSDGDL